MLTGSIAYAQSPGRYQSYQFCSMLCLRRYKVLIPLNAMEKRIFIQAPLPANMAESSALVDKTNIIPAIGDIRTTSIPPVVTRSLSNYHDKVVTFPVSVFEEARKKISFGFQLENGRDRQLTIRGKKLKQIKTFVESR